jgi:crossover junction endodeoxyribonuclease RusA
MTITVYGLPAPQGSKRHIGKGIMVESSKNVKPWREAVKWAAMSQPLALRDDSGKPLLSGPICVEMTFTMPRPKSAKTGSRPATRPDLSKLVRSTEDALTDIGAWEDDARVVLCISRKVYPGEHPDALATPGAVIKILRLGDKQ